MALKMTTTVSGVTVVDAIHRVRCVTLHGKARMAFLVKSYADNESSEAFSELGYECAYVTGGGPELSENPLAQAYAHLKSLPEYGSAIDA